MYRRQVWLLALSLLCSSGYALSQPATLNDQAPEAAPVTPEPGQPVTTFRKKHPSQSPADASAEHQSGLSATDARNVLEQGGYTSINGLHSDPNSIWVWQADAMKNGHRVRLGVDYRGNLLELSTAPAQPCTPSTPGFGAGPLGTGARLSEASRCTGG